MLDGGQQKWEAIEQVIRMDQSAVVVRLPESSTECPDDDDDERDEYAEKNEAADVGCFVPFVLVVVTHPHAPSLSERWRALAVSGPR